jgi:hypothetical protein
MSERHAEWKSRAAECRRAARAAMEAAAASADERTKAEFRRLASCLPIPEIQNRGGRRTRELHKRDVLEQEGIHYGTGQPRPFFGKP